VVSFSSLAAAWMPIGSDSLLPSDPHSRRNLLVLGAARRRGPGVV
jgi:hypothetical protein